MRDNGRIIRHVAGGSSGMLMETYLKENGEMIRLMDVECIFM